MLSYISVYVPGAGDAPPHQDGELMIADNRSRLAIAPWGSIFPMIALSTLVIGINLAADALAKAMGLDRSQEAPI